MARRLTFLEVMAGEEEMRMTYSQKRVLRKVLDNGDPEIAAEQIARAEDSRNLIAATKTLAKYGYVTTDPYILGPDDEPKSVELTEKGQGAADQYDVQNDETLITPDEQEESAPQGERPVAVEPPEAGAADLEGENVGLELSSFFHEINNLAKLT